LIETFHGALSTTDAWINVWLVDIENHPQYPGHHDDQYLRAKQVPGILSREQEEIAPPRVLQEEAQRVVKLGLLSDDLGERPDGRRRKTGYSVLPAKIAVPVKMRTK